MLAESAGFRNAVNELLHTVLVDDKIKARAVLRKMMDDEDQSAATRIKSAQELWNRAEGMPVQRTEKREMGLDELAGEIKRLSDKLGVTKPRVIDVTAEETEHERTEPTSSPPAEVRREGEV